MGQDDLADPPIVKPRARDIGNDLLTVNARAAVYQSKLTAAVQEINSAVQCVRHSKTIISSANDPYSFMNLHPYPPIKMKAAIRHPITRPTYAACPYNIRQALAMQETSYLQMYVYA